MLKVKNRVMTVLFLSTLGAGQVLATDFNYDEPKFEKINVCTPHDIMIEDIVSEIDSLSDQQIQTKISNLKYQRDLREAKLMSLESDKAQAQARLRSQKRRLNQLTNNMAQVKASIQKLVNQAQRDATGAQADLAHNKKKRSECKGGVFGTFCRSKYKGRTKDAQRDLDRAQVTKRAQQKKIAQLPIEKRVLPAKISKLEQRADDLQIAIGDTLAIVPSLAKLDQRIRTLISKFEAMESERENLEHDLVSAQEALGKCQNQRFLSKVYKVVMAQAEVFKKRPELCQNIDYLVQTTNQKFKKKGILDAAHLVCDLVTGQRSTNSNDYGDDREIPVVDNSVIFLDRVITSPKTMNGEYPNNFRSSNYEPKKVGQVGGQDVKSIKFKVTFDIERSFDYLLILDAGGQTVARIDGQGEQEIEVDSSMVEFFFYSDGRSAGQGFRVENIELQKY